MAIRDFEDLLPNIHPSAFIDDKALIIGQVSIGQNSSVWPFSVLRGDVNSITIGDNTNVQDHSVLHVSHDSHYHPGGYALTLGDDITIGHRVILHGCTINNNCLIGTGATIMDNVTIGENTLIGAGSLITPNKTLEPGFLWMGSPARKVRKLSDEDIESIQYSAQHYVRLKNRHLS